jgi:hypothetical protein
MVTTCEGYANITNSTAEKENCDLFETSINIDSYYVDVVVVSKEFN